MNVKTVLRELYVRCPLSHVAVADAGGGGLFAPRPCWSSGSAPRSLQEVRQLNRVQAERSHSHTTHPYPHIARKHQHRGGLLSFIARASLGRTGAKPPRADLGLRVALVITPSAA